MDFTGMEHEHKEENCEFCLKASEPRTYEVSVNDFQILTLAMSLQAALIRMKDIALSYVASQHPEAPAMIAGLNESLRFSNEFLHCFMKDRPDLLARWDRVQAAANES